MKCERCGADKSVERYDVGEFTGYLCEECKEVWTQIKER